MCLHPPPQCLPSHHPSYRLLHTVHAIALQWMPTQMTVYAQTFMTVFAQHCFNRKRRIIQGGWEEWGADSPKMKHSASSDKICHTSDFIFDCAVVRIRKLQPLENTAAAVFHRVESKTWHTNLTHGNYMLSSKVKLYSVKSSNLSWQTFLVGFIEEERVMMTNLLTNLFISWPEYVGSSDNDVRKA